MGHSTFIRHTFPIVIFLAHDIWGHRACSAADADGQERWRVSITSVSKTPKANLPDALEVYEATSLVRDDNFVSGLARKVGLSGELQRMPIDMAEAPGVWSFDNGGFAGRRRAVYASYKLDEIAFVTSDDGHRWDPNTKEWRIFAVPETKKAVVLAEDAVRGYYGIDLAKDEAGNVIFSESTVETTFLPRGATNRVSKAKKRQIKLYQELPNGKRIVNGDKVGWLEVGFVSEERIADIVGRPIKVKTTGRVRGLSSDEVVKALSEGKGWSWRKPRTEGSIEIKEIVVEYRTGNNDRRAFRLTPVYKIKYQPTSGVESQRAINYLYVDLIEWIK